jgi:hypothetical protein
MRVTPKTGHVIGAVMVGPDDDLLILTSANKIIRLPVQPINSVGRATQGVMLVRLEEGASVNGFDLVDPSEHQRAIFPKNSQRAASKVGPIVIDVPGDRKSEFAPAIVEKRHTDIAASRNASFPWTPRG